MCRVLKLWCLSFAIGTCMTNVFGNTFFFDDGSMTKACPFTKSCTQDAKFSPIGNESSTCCAPCMCSTECHLHGNCCPDVQHKADDNLLKPVCYFPVFNVDERTLYNNKMKFYTGINSYNAFVSCPTSYMVNRVKDLCENSPKDLFSFALVSDNMGVVYKNKYCAECHGKTTYDTWNLKIRCQTTEVESNIQMGNALEKFKPCMVWSLPPDPSVGRKSLCYNAIDACNVTGYLKNYNDTLKDKCEGYTLYYFHAIGQTTQLFKNVHCFLCNVNDQFGPGKCSTELFEVRNDKVLEFTGMLSKASFTLMSKPVKPKCRKRCQAWQMYDLLFNTCRKLTCQAGSVSFYGECLNMYKNTFGYSLSMLIELTPVGNLSTPRDKDKAYFDYPDNFNDMLRFLKAVSRSTTQYRNKCSLCSAILADGGNATIKHLKVLVTFHSNFECDINTLYESANKYALNKQRLFSFTTKQQMLTYKASANEELSSEGIDDLKSEHKASYIEKFCGLTKPFVGDIVCPRITLNSSEYGTFLKSTKQLVPVKQKLRLQAVEKFKEGVVPENGDKNGNEGIRNGMKVSFDYDMCSYHYKMAIGKCDGIHKAMLTNHIITLLCFIVFY